MIELKDIIKTENIIRISPKDSLAVALSKLRTSHDAAFIFNGNRECLGLINPYYALISSSYPGNAKVEHCLFHPPRVRIDYPIPKVARLFIESKIHYLPVVDEQENFLGIISARHLLSHYQYSPLFQIKIEQLLKAKNRPIISIFEDDTLATAINIFKKTKVSKLVVISKELKLKGILSYYDIISYLISPRNSPHRGEREGNRISFYHQKVKNFDRSYVLTLSPDNLASEALHLILTKKIGSVVIIDQERHPIGIITTKDFLRFLTQNGNEKKLEMTAINLSNQNRRILGGFFNNLTYVIKKIPDVTKAKLFVKEEKRGGLFKISLSLIPKKGVSQVIKKEGYNLAKLLNPISGVLKRIIRG